MQVQNYYNYLQNIHIMIDVYKIYLLLNIFLYFTFCVNILHSRLPLYDHRSIKVKLDMTKQSE